MAMPFALNYTIRRNPNVYDETEKNKIPKPFWVILTGLVYGLLLCGILAGSWKVFGDIYFSEYSKIRLVPFILVLIAGCFWNFNQLLAVGIIADRLVEGGPPSGNELTNSAPLKLPGILTVLMTILLKFSIFLTMPFPSAWWPANWRQYFNFLFPMMHSRVLILMGVWGKMGLVLSAGIGPENSAITSADRQFRKQMSIRSLLGNLALTLIITAFYISSYKNRLIGILVFFVLFMLIYLVSIILSWKFRGHDRMSMFACGEISEVLFLLSYLAISRLL
jgi:hypothetical protein